MGTKLPEAFRAIRAESARVGWPEAFKDDLHKHDRARLSHADAPPAFAWVLRATGTLLLDARMCARSRAGYLDHIRMSGASLLYWWDGTRLERIDNVETLNARMAPHAEPLPAAVGVGRGGY